MVRLYGNAPYKIILIHGGPGAIGSLKTCAEELSRLSNMGVIEALQSKYSLTELIEELYSQVLENCQEKATLIGHSWGSWLTVLFAEKHPELCANIILIGCPPLSDEYVEEISSRRLQRLTGEDRKIFRRLIEESTTEEDIQKMPIVLEKSDNYCLESIEANPASKTDSKMYNSIWHDAVKLRTNGTLLMAFKNIKSSLYLIQGVYDPHPIDGVTIPLEKNDVFCKTYVLENCGHNPFLEKYAKEEFYKTILQVI